MPVVPYKNQICVQNLQLNLKLVGLRIEIPPGFTDWSPDVIHAMFSKPAFSNLSAAAVDLITIPNQTDYHYLDLLSFALMSFLYL